jgi:hypothetical protein
MRAVICGVNGCSRRLQPVLKVDPRDRDTWVYPECDECGRPACDEHAAEVDGRRVCDRCRRDAGPPLLDLGLNRLPGPGG